MCLNLIQKIPANRRIRLSEPPRNTRWTPDTAKDDEQSDLNKTDNAINPEVSPDDLPGSTLP